MPRFLFIPLMFLSAATPAAAGALGQTLVSMSDDSGAVLGYATASSHNFSEQATSLDEDCVAGSEAVHMRALRSDCPARPLNPSGGGPAARDDGGRDDPPRNVGFGGTTPLPPKPSVLKALRLERSHFWVNGPIENGTRISYRLTERAKVTFIVDRLTTGGVAVNRVGSFRKNGRAGTNEIKVAGTLGLKELPRGHYRLVAIPDRGRGGTARFEVIPAPQIQVKA